jgi:hypothetical protein
VEQDEKYFALFKVVGVLLLLALTEQHAVSTARDYPLFRFNDARKCAAGESTVTLPKAGPTLIAKQRNSLMS